MSLLEGLTIVVPTLDAAALIDATLDSVRPAIDRGARIIVVDGGSADDTVGRARRHGCEVITHAGNMYEAINAGCRSVDSQWLTWINADDLLYADGLPERLARHMDADVLYGAVDFIDTSGRFVHCWMSAAPRDLLPLYRAGYSPLLQQGAIFRRTLFEAVGGFDASYRFVGDADFWWRCLERGGRFHRQAAPSVAAFRLHHGQASQRHASAMRGEHLRMVEAHGARPRPWSALPEVARLRFGNAANYLVRFMRRSNLSGRPSLVRSYDVPDA